MKSLIKGFLFVIIFIFSVLIAICITQKSVQSKELYRIVSNAMQETQRVKADARYSISSNEEYLAEFSQHLMRLSSSCDDLKIEVYGIDYESGLLDVCVKTNVNYITGKNEELKVRKTSIVDCNEDESGG